MSVLFVAVPIAVLLASSGMVAFIWATRHGQLDDLETPPLRMLLDDDGAPQPADDTCSPGGAVRADAGGPMNG
jgi:cbb3-type cytochrome oxidase maturation protein